MPETQPPVSEPSIDDLRTRVQALEGELSQANQTIASLERRQQIDALLREADAIDLEAGRLLTEVAVASMAEPDVKAAVADLQRHKPYLFRSRRGAASAMAAHEDAAAHDDASERAAQTGSRRDLLRYLRLRRNG